MNSIMFPFWALWVFFPCTCWLSRHHQPIGNWLDNVSLWHIIHFFAEAKFSHNIRIASTYSRALWCVCVRTLHSIATVIYWQCHFYYIILYIWFRLTSVFMYTVHRVAPSEFQSAFFRCCCFKLSVRHIKSELIAKNSIIGKIRSKQM